MNIEWTKRRAIANLANFIEVHRGVGNLLRNCASVKAEATKGNDLHIPHSALLKPHIQIGGRDGTRTHFLHRDRMESRLFEFTPQLAPGAGLAPTHAASKAAELRLFNPGTKHGGSPGTCALPNRLKAGCSNCPSSRSENWGLQPVMLRQRFATREARRLLHEGMVG